MLKRGEVLKIFVMGGEFNGLKAIQVANWSGQAFLGRRSHVRISSQIPALSKTGIYFLGSDDQNEAGLFKVYVGESDSFDVRLKQHNSSKTWWDWFLVFTSGDDNLTKAHAKYLEGRLYELLDQSKESVELMNTGTPSGSKLPEAEASFAEGFLEKIILVLGTVGHEYMVSQVDTGFIETDGASENLVTMNQNPDARKLLYHSLNGQRFKISVPTDEGQSLSNPEGFMRVENGKFILEKGSVIRATAVPSFKTRSSAYFTEWEKVKKEFSSPISGTENYRKINKDIEFTAPSPVGAICMARAVNGVTIWKRVPDGKRLKECLFEKQSSQVEADEAA